MLIEGSSHFIFPTNCFIVDGAERALIYDLHRGDYDIIPLELSAAIQNCGSKCFADLFAALPPEDLDFYRPFIQELVNKDYLIPIDSNEPGFFEPMDKTWYYPYPVSSAIIEYTRNSPFLLEEVLARIDELNCQAVEIRLPEAWDLDFYAALSKAIDGKIFRHVDLVIRYKEGQDPAFLFAIKELHPVFFCVTQYDAPEDKLVKNQVGENAGIKTTRKVYNELVNDHQVYPKNFYINREFFTEAVHHHPYFNGKIVVMADGSVKNATNVDWSFGHINEVDLAWVVQSESFRYLWNVTKDQIQVCRDCEYRYMCMDSRVPIKNELDEWVYTEACNYDPYNCEWGHVPQTAMEKTI